MKVAAGSGRVEAVLLDLSTISAVTESLYVAVSPARRRHSNAQQRKEKLVMIDNKYGFVHIAISLSSPLLTDGYQLVNALLYVGRGGVWASNLLAVMSHDQLTLCDSVIDLMAMGTSGDRIRILTNAVSNSVWHHQLRE